MPSLGTFGEPRPLKQLPVEIWARVIGFITDSRYLPRVWLHFRQVSRGFKTATELAFVQKHLQYTNVEFGPWSMVKDRDQNKVSCRLTLVFKGLAGEDRDRAIFASDEDLESTKATQLEEFMGGITLHRHLTNQWRIEFGPYSDPPPDSVFAWPPHILAVRREANDTELPGLRVDWEEHQISVLWKPMLSLFFGELEYMKWADRIELQHSGFLARSQVMAEKVKAGEVSIDEFIHFGLHHAARQQDTILKTVRRQRFRRWYMKHAGYTEDQEIDEDETKLRHLISARNDIGNWSDFNDEWMDNAPESHRGTFYDGMGMCYQGKSAKDDGEITSQSA